MNSAWVSASSPFLHHWSIISAYGAKASKKSRHSGCPADNMWVALLNCRSLSRTYRVREAQTCVRDLANTDVEGRQHVRGCFCGVAETHLRRL
jgi:hypothetical protein